MDCTLITGEIQEHVYTNTSSTRYIWLTSWYPCHGMDKVRAVIKRSAVTVTTNKHLKFRLAWQTAAVRPNEPDAPTTDQGNEYQDAGENCTGNVSLSTTEKFFIRFGLAYYMSDTSSEGEAEISLQVTAENTGKVVGSASVELIAPSYQDNYFFPVTPWLPAMSLAKVKAMFIVTGASPEFQVRLAKQTATTSQEDPGSWTEVATTWYAGSDENVLADTTVTTSDMWVRFAIEYSCTSSNVNKHGNVTCTVAARK